jgi:hypothetical protein
VLAARPDLLQIRDGLASFSRNPRPRFTAFADIDLLYYQGLGHGNYDWLQRQIVRSAFPFAEEQSLATLVDKFQLAFPISQRMVGIVNRTDRVSTIKGATSGSVAIIDDAFNVPHGSFSVRNKVGEQLHLPTGECVPFREQPGYIELK